MKKTLVIALVAVAACDFARANYSLSSDLTFASEYIFRGKQSGSNTMQPSIELSTDKYYAGVWCALPINDRSSKGWGDEFDFYAGYTPRLSDTVSLDFGLTEYYYPAGGSTLEGFAGASAKLKGGLTPSVYAYYDFDLKNTTVQGSLGYSIPLGSVGTSIDLSGTFGYVSVNDTVNNGPSYSYYGFSAVVPYKLNENATITVGAHWSDTDLNNYKVDNKLYYTAGLTIGF